MHIRHGRIYLNIKYALAHLVTSNQLLIRNKIFAKTHTELLFRSLL